MDKETQRYRLSEINSLKSDLVYKNSIKLFGSGGGSTKTIALSNDEFFKIVQILTEPKKEDT